MSDDDFIALLKEVPANPGAIKWLQDKHGTTTELKAAALKMAGKIKGDKDKQKLALRTLAIISQHIKARLAADELAAQTRLKRIQTTAEERRSRQSFGELEAKVDS